MIIITITAFILYTPVYLFDVNYVCLTFIAVFFMSTIMINIIYNYIMTFYHQCRYTYT